MKTISNIPCFSPLSPSFVPRGITFRTSRLLFALSSPLPSSLPHPPPPPPPSSYVRTMPESATASPLPQFIFSHCLNGSILSKFFFCFMAYQKQQLPKPLLSTLGYLHLHNALWHGYVSVYIGMYVRVCLSDNFNSRIIDTRNNPIRCIPSDGPMYQSP